MKKLLLILLIFTLCFIPAHSKDTTTSCTPKVKSLGEFEITYYCDTGLTYSGIQVHKGTCAVDPNVIPLGSTIFIKYEDNSIRECIAEDTGSAVKGNIVDIWLPDETTCWELGREKGEVYIEND